MSIEFDVPVIKPEKIDILDLPPKCREFVKEKYPNRIIFYRYPNRPHPGFDEPEYFKTFWGDGDYMYGFYNVAGKKEEVETPPDDYESRTYELTDGEKRMIESMRSRKGKSKTKKSTVKKRKTK